MKAFQRLYRRTRGLWLQCLALYYAFSDRRTPWYAKAIIIVSLLYLVSPIDIIPDLIPIAGYLDDIVVVPLLFTFAARLVPRNIMRSSHLKAEERIYIAKRNLLKTLLLAVLWLFVAVIVVRYLVMAIRN
ncbi:DUF1232 domain-containing protein [Danxiaibacter flavus]|uniref:DUF1232 domain-containing protein n=1 Tax=Danxiaibacter flavus TaxID=3049108 RepID=A0ABV3ZFM8_9BACT|nr:DUF1232 domain-containing protein [Chitinophagaceae bacterium DXS]